MEDNNFDSWIAGFWEGEGTIYKVKKERNTNYCIAISQAIEFKRNVESTMERIQKTYGGHITKVNFKNKNYKSQLMWRLSKRGDVIKFINSIYPYCQIRKQDLENCLLYFKTHPRLDHKNVDIDMKKINTLRSNGISYAEIAKIIGILSSSGIWYRLHKKPEECYL
jgi:hypothetical protein